MTLFQYTKRGYLHYALLMLPFALIAIALAASSCWERLRASLDPWRVGAAAAAAVVAIAEETVRNEIAPSDRAEGQEEHAGPLLRRPKTAQLLLWCHRWFPNASSAAARQPSTSWRDIKWATGARSWSKAIEWISRKGKGAKSER